MDVIGNNIANVNTAGYKTSRVIFQDIFSQNVASGMASNEATPGQGGVGGTNPLQIGLGIKLSTVDVIHSRAAFQRTDRETDMMINGDGYFIVRGPEGDFYTRAGNFDIDNNGVLVNSLGFAVMGYGFNLVMEAISLGEPERPARAAVAAGQPIPADYIIPANYFQVGDVIPANAFGAGSPAAEVTISAANLEEYSNARTVVNPFNAPRSIPQVSFKEAVPPRFGLVQGPPMVGDMNGLSEIRLVGLAKVLPPINTVTGLPGDCPPRPAGMSDENYKILLDGWINTVTQEEEVSLPGFSVAANGDISVILDNRKVVIAQLAIAMFSNPAGLEKAGNSLYRQSASSGPTLVTQAYQDGAGKIDGGGLEMSNVDLASEFTDMIVTQRGFQANSRIITVSDTMLEELVNLKR